MRPVEGTLLGNRYKLTSRIAVGGMGEVWKGVDSVLGREVAAKILKDEYLSESTFLARFRAEAQNMGRVSDPGIAGVYDYGDEQGSPYLVMEYVPGEALSAIIERSAPLSETDTLSIVTQAAQALGAAHKVGVIHRDIKPGNILMTPDFRVKITDFGIARVTDQAPLTKTGQVMGTAQYLAPEQATGKGSGPGSDLYALGIIAYEALAGQRPFTGDSQVAIAIAQVNQQHPPLPDTVSEPLRRFVDCLLEKKPERRPSEAFKVAKAAEALSAGDIAGAEELVPQMRHGAAASEALTQVFNNPEPAATTKTLPVTSSNDATQVYPNGAAAGIAGAGAAGAGAAAANTGQIDPNDPQNQDLEKDKQSNKGRILIWILAIIALIAVGSLLWFFLGGGNAEPEPEPSTSAPTSEAAKTIEIDKNDYIGLTESSATQNLENKGLEVETTDINSDRAAGTVADVGEGDNGYTFEEGDTVTLYISAGPAEQPEEPASDSGSDSGLGNDSESSSDSDSSSDSQDQGSDSGSDSANSDTGSDSSSSSNSSSNSSSGSGSSSESDSSSSSDSSSGSDSSSSGDSASSDSNGGSNPNSGNDGAGDNPGGLSSSDALGNPIGNPGDE